MSGLILQVLDNIRGSWRYRWWALAAAWGICVIGWVGVFFVPSIYEASARVYVDSQSVLRPLLKGLAVDPDYESNLSLVRQAVLSRPHMEKIAHETGLDVRAHSPEDMDELIESLRTRVIIEPDPHARVSATDGVYRITFRDTSRAKALEVVRSLLDSFVEDTLGNKRTGQADAERFLRAQLAEYDKRLSAAEQRLADFKKRNVGKMPGDKGDYFARLQTEMSALDEVRQNLSLAQTRRDEIARQLNGEEPYVFGFGAQAPTTTAEGGAGDVSMRIQALESKLEELRLRFTDKHPDVIAVRDTIEQLKKQEAAELARINSGKKATGSLSQSLKTNPVYQALEVELKRTDVQIAELKEDVAQRQARVAQLHRMVDTVPEVEAELAKLNRDYEVTRGEYQQLAQRLETAKLSAEADRTGELKFQIIDPPDAALQPVAPNRPLLLTGMLLFGLGGAVGLAYLLNLLHPVFHNMRSLADVTGLPVLGIVTRSVDAPDRVRARMQLSAFILGITALMVVYMAVVLLQGAGVQIPGQLKG